MSERATSEVVARAEPLLPEAEERARLERAWGRPPGLLGWLRSVSHQEIGRRYVVTAFVFFALAGLGALAMRTQLARAESGLVGPELYDQLFSVHGTTMMFLFAVPVMDGMALWLLPLMLGTRNVAYPRLNAYGYWVYALAGVLLWGSLLIGAAPDTGWFSYVPLSMPEFSPEKRVDVWTQLISLTEIAALVAAVEIIVTIFRQRAPGMSLDRMPLFAWAMLVTAFMVVFAMPAVMIATGYLTLDRLVETRFYDVSRGGDALLYQHAFWFFGHPEVYIIFVPATGFVSSIVATFTRRPVFGYAAIVLSLVAVGFLSFGLWVHHMFTVGLPQLGESFFTAATLLIAVPNGLQIFCWLATLRLGRPVFRTPLLYVLGFIVTFVLGGLTGVMQASVPIDQQVHDSYFVVAHFHYVLVGGAVFPLLGAIHYWFPKLTGRMPSERLGQIAFALIFVGFHLTFFPMHTLGLDGMPRRVYTYLPETGWEPLNLLATAGSYVLALGVAAYVSNVLWSLRRGAPAGDDPWQADTLEWSTSSPPPPYNFVHPPVVVSREGRWATDGQRVFVTGVDPDEPYVLLTHLVDAEPELQQRLPGPSIFPFLTALGTVATFAGLIFTPWAFVIAGVPTLATLLGWLKREPPRPGEGNEPAGAPAPEPAP